MTGPRTKAGKALLDWLDKAFTDPPIGHGTYLALRPNVLNTLANVEAEASAVPEGLREEAPRPTSGRATEGDIWRKFHADIAEARLVGRRRQIIEDAARDYAYLRVALDRVERAALAAAPAKAEGLDGDVLLSILRYWFPDRDGKVYEVARQEAVAAILAAVPAKAEGLDVEECHAPDCRKVAGHGGDHFPVPGDGAIDSLRGGYSVKTHSCPICGDVHLAAAYLADTATEGEDR